MINNVVTVLTPCPDCEGLIATQFTIQTEIVQDVKVEFGERQQRYYVRGHIRGNRESMVDHFQRCHPESVSKVTS